MVFFLARRSSPRHNPIATVSRVTDPSNVHTAVSGLGFSRVPKRNFSDFSLTEFVERCSQHVLLLGVRRSTAQSVRDGQNTWILRSLQALLILPGIWLRLQAHVEVASTLVIRDEATARPKRYDPYLGAGKPSVVPGHRPTGPCSRSAEVGLSSCLTVSQPTNRLKQLPRYVARSVCVSPLFAVCNGTVSISGLFGIPFRWRVFSIRLPQVVYCRELFWDSQWVRVVGK